jgi:hypothetical protein
MLRPGSVILFSPPYDGPPLGLLSSGLELSANGWRCAPFADNRIGLSELTRVC